jgi:DNA-directed RNA polymerase subunit H (RpoH/RPB5)
MDLNFLHRLGLAYKNALYMIQDRGYEVNSIMLEMEPLQIAGHFYSAAISKSKSLSHVMRASFRAAGHNLGDLTLWILDRNYDVLKCRDKMISTDQIKSMAEQISQDDAETAIILSPFKLSPQAKKEYLKGEIFLFDDLLIRLPEHVLVVKHKEISLNNARDVLGQSFNPNHLPILPTSDPIARWYNFKKGSIIYIQNPIMPTFRIVA